MLRYTSLCLARATQEAELRIVDDFSGGDEVVDNVVAVGSSAGRFGQKFEFWCRFLGRATKKATPYRVESIDKGLIFRLNTTTNR